MDKRILKKKWLMFSISGLVLTGFGLSLFGEASYLKNSGAPVWDWILLGTAALIVFNSGLSLFGQGVVYRVRMNLK
ncbi:MAG: hypothetical protein AAF519_15435 [Bacteroidota bacterium]